MLLLFLKFIFKVFAVDETLDDGVEIDLIFAQIIADCRRNIPYRIRKFEREVVNQILCEFFRNVFQANKLK